MKINNMEINSPEAIRSRLASVGYYADQLTADTVYLALMSGRPLLLEGRPGQGKTALAKAVADALGLPLVRAQMYEGITDDKLLYDYNYQKQLLVMECVKDRLVEEFGKTPVEDLVHTAATKINFYGPEFLVERPILKTINGTGRKVLLIDEIDKAPEEVEHMLYEYCENFSISIPQYKTITCPEDQRPIVFFTSNGYRELTDALRRRCLYFYLRDKTRSEIVDILTTAVVADPKLVECVAICLEKSQQTTLNQIPSISEGIDWLTYLASKDKVQLADFMNSLGFIIKDYHDDGVIRQIVAESEAEVYGG